MALVSSGVALHALSLCSGIGGIEFGLTAAIGPVYRTVCYVEREAYCASVLAARMAEGQLHDAPIWSDLATFDGKPWRGRVDIVTAGYPCQPFSCAGRRRGESDHRHLWPHVARIIGELEPAYAFLENVPGHVSLGLRDVCADLRRMGYDVAAGIFSAAECGAPHIRKRLFILATNTNSQRQLQPQRMQSNERRRSGNGSRWEVESGVGRVADGVPARVDRLRALGNAVVPATAALAWMTLFGKDRGLNETR